jgi:glutamyl-tRNA reductase
MMNATGAVTGVSVSHSTATVDDVARAGAADQRAEVAELIEKPYVTEAFALHTCNRTEAYVVTDDASVGRAAFETFAPHVDDESVHYMDHEESLAHLMRVAGGLESLVLGEDQILGQVRTAYEDARGEGGIGPMLEDAVTKAIHVGERVRTETEINEGIVSLGSAAATVAMRELDTDAPTALVIGAGEMGTTAVKALADRGVDDIVVANRTMPHAEHLASEVDADATAVPLQGADAVAERADLVVSTTASDSPIIGVEPFETEGETVVVDLAQPRDVDPRVADIERVTVYDLDTLTSVTEQTRRQRRAAAEEAEEIIDAEFDRLVNQYKRKRADEVIAAMYESADRVKSQEVSTAVSKLETEADADLSAEEREVVESMADALVSKLLAPPTKSLREAAGEDDWTTINTALQLFDPEFDGETYPPMPPEGIDPEEFVDGLPDGISPEELPDEFPDEITESVLSDD